MAACSVQKPDDERIRATFVRAGLGIRSKARIGQPTRRVEVAIPAVDQKQGCGPDDAAQNGVGEASHLLEVRVQRNGGRETGEEDGQGVSSGDRAMLVWESELVEVWEKDARKQRKIRFAEAQHIKNTS